MILDKLFSNKNNVILKKVLDFSAQNHKIIANNIANVETPGFTAKKLVFENELRGAIKSGDISSIKGVKSFIKEDVSSPYRMDMNNVDLEKEMIKMEENRLRYEMVGSLLQKKLSKWKEIFAGVK